MYLKIQNIKLKEEKFLENVKQREQFGSKLGFILAASGSAIGLGNIWKFPYITGENGGSAFIIIYLLAIALIGFPIMLSEFLIGRSTQKNAVESFKELAPGKYWHFIGYMGVAAAFMILSFYGVVAGWTLSYAYDAATGVLGSLAPSEMGDYFSGFISSPLEPILWQLLFMVFTVAIVLGGVSKGIERWSKILMPTLFILVLIIMIRSLTLPGAGAGVEFLLKPDFSKLTGTSFLIAIGHAFFSLSLGMGTMLTYSSYLPKDQKLPSAALNVSIMDTLIALLAGFMIFPAVFAFGMDPGQGPGLVFITLPAVFQQMPLGDLFAVLFFLLLAIAALTSAISILEVPVAFFSDKYKWSRTKTTLFIGTLIFLVGAAASLSYGPWGGFKIKGYVFFDQLDFVASYILLPLGGFFIALFVGFVLKNKKALELADFTESSIIGKYWFLVLKYIAPILIFVVFLNSTGLLQKLKAFLQTFI